MALKAAVHSVETAGALDGPGIRYVLFLYGCPFRCKFCHNPDTWTASKKSLKSVDEVYEDILKYEPFFKFSNGGVTVSGGEPTMHLEFLIELFGKLKKRGIHTALDTCGYCEITPELEKLLSLTDLVLLDIKHLDPLWHMELTGKPNALVLKFLKYLQKIKKTVWIRTVMIEGWTDSLDYAKSLAKFLKRYSVVKKIELLPYHDMGRKKWEALGLKYQFENLKTPSSQRIKEFKKIFDDAGINVIVQ